MKNLFSSYLFNGFLPPLLLLLLMLLMLASVLIMLLLLLLLVAMLLGLEEMTMVVWLPTSLILLTVPT